MSEYFANKAAARKAILALGYTDHYLTGQCGDGGHGSREYYKAPNAELNEYGAPVTKHGTISKVGKRWALADFNPAPVAKSENAKYDYPAGLTAAQKKAFRAKARKGA